MSEQCLSDQLYQLGLWVATRYRDQTTMAYIKQRFIFPASHPLEVNRQLFHHGINVMGISGVH